MARTSEITCDYCTDSIELEDEELVIERGWLEVARYDTIRGDVIHHDFCSEECLISHFQ